MVPHWWAKRSVKRAASVPWWEERACHAAAAFSGVSWRRRAEKASDCSSGSEVARIWLMRSGMAAASGGVEGREDEVAEEEVADGRAEGVGLCGDEAEREEGVVRAVVGGEEAAGRVASHVRAEAETAERRQRREGRSMWAGLRNLMWRGRER
jgi:hypothetical protein